MASTAALYAGTSATGKSIRTNQYIYALAIDPRSPATLYAGTGGGVFKSTNSGGTWAAATLYAGAWVFGVFKTTNSGGTWAAANAGLTNQYVLALAIDPSSPATLYAGTYGGGAFKSTNSGGGWTGANTGLTSMQIYALAIDPTSPATLYAGTSSGGAFKSTNSGERSGASGRPGWRAGSDAPTPPRA